MSGFRKLDPNYVNWCNGKPLPASYPGKSTASNDAAQARRRGELRTNEGRATSTKNAQDAMGPAPAALHPADSWPAPTTAAAHFWAYSTAGERAGFQSTAATLAAAATKNRMQSPEGPILHTPYFIEVNRPLRKDESPWDPDMFPPRAAAIVAGFVQREEDVGKKRREWFREPPWQELGDGTVDPRKKRRKGKGGGGGAK
ncbi:hypothetical protein BDW02DRAFT_581463 [Decorospora gaudefroyi]|uniref:Uncharacterized protein n=1 Tax=Decorospora gaudefroyi TaxID=184978 RepID=A0A6A5K5H1_9PLEO|nr:hypothetical protein BDW02DRAFT_581463 [Decorospora gaudefroyi]